MYKRINQITVNDEKLNVYVIFNEYSKRYLYGLFILDDKPLKRLFHKELTKTILVSLGLLMLLTLIVASIIHVFTSDVMSTNAVLSVIYLLFWSTFCITLPGTVPIVALCFRSFLSFFKEETFVNTIGSEAKTCGRRIYIFSLLKNYRNKNDNREKSFAFVKYLESLKVSELEEIFHNDFKRRKLLEENEKIERILNDEHCINGFEDDLKNKLHKNDEKINFYRDYQNRQEEKIKEFYEKSIKEKSEKEILDLLAS